VATDFADGRVARLRGEASRLGGFLDHAVDATFVVLGLAALAHAGVVPALLPPAIATAFVQYAIDSRVVSGGRLRASALGRWNGILYYVLLGVPVVRDGLGLGFPGDSVVRVLGWLLVLATLASIADRAWALKQR
jgi:phosphatidylglycerophosphate synthase